MNNDVNNILPNDNDADKLELLHALNNDTFNDEDLFEADAKEGLQQMDEQHVASIVNKLNANLNHQIKKKKKQRRGIPSQQGLYVTIITILLLAIIAYIVIKKVLS
jgi:LDH2 family malate/lactate/ureidoglycolate dehydrogenase